MPLIQRRPKNELVLCDDSLTWGAVGDAIEASEPSRLIRQHTKLTIEAPIEEEKEEEKHDENTKPIKQKIKEKEEVECTCSSLGERNCLINFQVGISSRHKACELVVQRVEEIIGG